MRYDFKSLIRWYSSPHIFQVKRKKGYYDEFNEWVDDDVELVNIFGAITRLTQDDLVYLEGGTYSYDDRKLYCYTDMKKGEKVIHRDKTYTIQGKMDYSEFDNNLYLYHLRRGERD